jgi:uncharacterized protein YqeY
MEKIMAVNLVQIKADQLQARKDKNGLKASLLTTLIGEIESNLTRLDATLREAKSDETTVATINSFLKNNRKAQDDMSISEIHPDAVVQNLIDLREEAVILNAYLPQQLTVEQLEQIFNTTFPNGMKASDRGTAMKVLKANYAGQYNGQTASDVLTKLIK